MVLDRVNYVIYNSFRYLELFYESVMSQRKLVLNFGIEIQFFWNYQ